VFTRARHLSLSWVRWIQSTDLNPISLRFIPMLSSLLFLGLPSGFLPPGYELLSYWLNVFIRAHALAGKKEMWEGKSKFVLCFFLTEHHAMEAYWGVEVKLHAFLTSALDGDEWSASRLGRFTPRERVPDNHWRWGWVGPRAGLEITVEIINLRTVFSKDRNYLRYWNVIPCSTEWRIISNRTHRT
jgi:hypothetical protein